MRDAAQRCSRWRRIRIANCSFRSGSRIGANRISSLPATTRAVSTDSSRCAGVVSVSCTAKVTVLVCATVPSASGRGWTGSKDGLGVGVVMAAMVGRPTFASNVHETGDRT